MLYDYYYYCTVPISSHSALLSRQDQFRCNPTLNGGSHQYIKEQIIEPNNLRGRGGRGSGGGAMQCADW